MVEPMPECKPVVEHKPVVMEAERMPERGVAEARAGEGSGMSHAAHVRKHGVAAEAAMREPTMSEATVSKSAVPAHTTHAAGKRGRAEARRCCDRRERDERDYSRTHHDSLPC